MYEGQIENMHDSSIRAAIVKVEGHPSPGVRVVVAYFTSTELAQTAADAMTAEAAAGPFPDTRFEVIPARCSHP